MKRKLFAIILLIVLTFSLGVLLSSCDDDLGEKVGEIAISIECKTILDNMDKVDKGILDNNLIPDDGIILAETTMSVYSKDNVFTAIKRICKQKNIHIDYDLSYIKGINHIYEMSVGENSGWMYFVNGEEPTVGATQYKLKGGEKVLFAYTCVVGDLK